MRVSIVIPTLNEEAVIGSTLTGLQVIRRAGHEVILADGGSNDYTIAIGTPLADRVVQSERGRALQMNAGARAASGDVLLFLHADTQLPTSSFTCLLDDWPKSAKCWGRFDVRLSGTQWMFRVIECMMNWRSCITSVATGDQAIFVDAKVFNAVGGFDAIPLMEDIALSKKLRKRSNPLCLRATVTTSSRRWERGGVWRTVLLMWRLRLWYFCGGDPASLARVYRTAVR